MIGWSSGLDLRMVGAVICLGSFWRMELTLAWTSCTARSMSRLSSNSMVTVPSLFSDSEVTLRMLWMLITALSTMSTTEVSITSGAAPSRRMLTETTG